MVCQAEGTVTPDGRHCPHLLIWLQLKHSLWFLRRNWWNLHVPFPRQRLGTGLLWLFFLADAESSLDKVGDRVSLGLPGGHVAPMAGPTPLPRTWPRRQEGH